MTYSAIMLQLAYFYIHFSNTRRDIVKNKIGILDSGIGGLSTVKSIQMLLPGEDIIYFGDNKNMPFGNRSADEILSLSMNILKFMNKQDVKMVGIACNTISSLYERYKDEFSFPIIDIINPTVDYIIEKETYNISIIATEFTINSGFYRKRILAKNRDISIITEGCKTLAGLIDAGEFDSPNLKKTIEGHLNNLMAKGDVYNLILACTHYPIVENVFKDIAPHINLINPSFQQAKAIRKYLDEHGQLSDNDVGSVDVYTSGEVQVYDKVIERFNLKNIIGIHKV